MKTAVTSQGKDLNSVMDPRFGRCRWFILVDTETGQYQAVSNDQNLSAPQGAGIQAAETVSRLGVQAVITGHCGPKAFKVLQAAGIKVYTGAQGTVGEILHKFKNGMFDEAGAADVEGHWM